MGAKERELRFSMESIKYLDQVKDQVWGSVRAIAISKVTGEGRDVVTIDDIRASIEEGLQQVLHESIPAQIGH